MSVFYRLYHYIARLLFALLTRRRVVSGLEHIPPQGAAIMVSNHLSMIDPILVMASFPRQVCFMTKIEAYRAFPLRLMAPLAGAFPVRRGKPDRVALRRAEEVLRDGHILGIYPEGHRSETHQIQDARTGVVFLALRTGAPILPVATWGTEGVFSRRFPYYRRVPVYLAVGEPFRLEDLVDDVRKVDKQALANMVMERIAAMLPPLYRGALFNTDEALVAKL